MGANRLIKSGHFPTLVAAFLYFDVSFMVWVLLGPLAPFISQEFHLTPFQKGLLTAIPLLGGALFRPMLGVLGERFGERRTGLLGLAVTLIPLILGWNFSHTPAQFYAVGFLLGVAGASFAVALPIAGRWYPLEYQGLVMGIAGAGNSGTLLATLLAPRLAQRFGWHNAFALAAIPVLLVLTVFAVLAKDSPKRSAMPQWKDYAALLREPDAAWFCFLYSFTFGGFVGLASLLTTFFHDQYAVTKVQAGDFTTIVVLAGSFLRPVGGWLSDKMGGYRLLLFLLAGVALCLTGVGMLPALPLEAALLFLTLGMLGMGNGAVFQLVPQRFSERVGALTGLVGAAGGFGGFFLPFFLGALRQRTGQYSGGLFLFGTAFFLAALILLQLGTRWRTSWQAAAVQRTGIFSYRNFGSPMEEPADSNGCGESFIN